MEPTAVGENLSQRKSTLTRDSVMTHQRAKKNRIRGRLGRELQMHVLDSD